MTLGFLFGSKNFCTDTTGSIGWPSPAPRLHIDDCFEIHNFHWELCDLLLSSHQYFDARGTAPPMRLLHGALVILVLWQISQYRSLGKWVKNTVFTQFHTSRGCRLYRWFMRRTGVWVSAFRNSIIHEISSEFLQPFRYFRIQRVAPFCSFNMWTWHRCWMGICPTQIFPFSSLTFALHCSWWSRRAWGRCRMIALLSWRCHWGWRMRTGGRTRWQAWNHDRNEVLRITLYSNPVFNEMWFLTVDPLIRISVFIAKLYER